MAGIYLHIPFCKTRCVYCDFYSTTHKEQRTRYVHALCRELQMRREYLRGETIQTVYLGGGTPSQLTEDELKLIFDTLQQIYGLQETKEITLEANPDDLTEEYAAMLARLPVNRISMGIQTFDDSTLHLLNRRHTAAQAIEAVAHCRQAGFHNISIDLIYGLPGETEERWIHDLLQAIALDVEHLSAYHLTYEEGTRLYQLLQERQVEEVDEESSVRFYHLLTDTLRQAGYEHYEISNFCKPGMHSRHNTAYWQDIPYLGCGASAHSYDRSSREWNIASLVSYMDALEGGNRLYEREELTLPVRYNEYLMTGLRTRQGISLDHLRQAFGTYYLYYCLQMATPHIHNGKLEISDNRLKLTGNGIFTSDGILSDLMYVEEAD